MAQDRIFGKDVMIYVESLSTPGTFYPIACSTNCEISLSSTFLNVTDATSGVFLEVIPDQISGTMSGVGLVQINKDRQIFSIVEYILARQKVVVRFKVDAATTVSPNVTTKRIQALGYFNASSIQAAYGDISRYNYSIQLTGTITLT